MATTDPPDQPKWAVCFWGPGEKKNRYARGVRNYWAEKRGWEKDLLKDAQTTRIGIEVGNAICMGLKGNFCLKPWNLGNFGCGSAQEEKAELSARW